MNARQARCGEPYCQWCGRAKILIDRHDRTPPGLLSKLPPQAVLLCPRCDEAGHGAGPLATLIALRSAQQLKERP